MHDLRKKAMLESGKTVSKKLKSREVSGANSKSTSPANSKNGSPMASRNGSRVVSRNASDDESDESSMTHFSNSSGDSLVEEDPEGKTDNQFLAETVDGLLEKKIDSQARETLLDRLLTILTTHYVDPESSGHLDELLPILLKTAKRDVSERESLLSLRVLSLMIITEPSGQLYETVEPVVKQIITDSQQTTSKAAAIHTLAIATFFGGVSEDEVKDVMTFLQEIIESDGTSVDAEDSADVVAAALEEWGFLATKVDDIEDTSHETIEALVDQLDSTDTNVLIAAGENVALLYERSFTELEDDEDPSIAFSDSDEDAEIEDIHGDKHAPKYVKRYDVYARQYQLNQRLEELAKVSAKYLSKEKRRSLHSHFRDILHSVENPTRGPGYNAHLNKSTGMAFGSQMVVGVGGRNIVRIKTWQQLHRVKALKRALKAGFATHYADNEVVFETIPVMLETPGRMVVGKRFKKGSRPVFSSMEESLWQD